MLNDRESGYVAGQIVQRLDEEHQEKIRVLSPAYTLQPALHREGNQWMALFGDFQDGIAGFGDSPYEAYEDFNAQWHRSI